MRQTMTHPAPLAQMLKERGHLHVIPLMGFPGVQITRTTLKRNLSNWDTQFRTLFELVQRFQPDGAFTFMDLSAEAGALGLPVRFPLNEPPSVERPVLRSEEELRGFYGIDVLKEGRTRVFVETMHLMKRYLNVLRGGYVIGPYTLAALMMGAEDAAVATLLSPSLLHETLAFTTRVISRYARALTSAGADMVAILEPSAVVLSPRLFREFSARYVRQAIAAIEVVPILHICGNTSHLVDEMVATGAQGLSLDSLVDLPEIARRVPSDMVLIGNISPTAVMVSMSPEQVYAETQALVKAMAPYPNFILSTGCDLPQETPLANIQAFMDAGRGRPLGHPTGDLTSMPSVLKEAPEEILAALESPCDCGRMTRD